MTIEGMRWGVRKEGAIMTEEKDIFDELSPEAQEELANGKAEKEDNNEQ